MTLPAITPSPWRMERVATLRPLLLPFLLFAVIGIELMTLAAWLPDTFWVWWNVENVGDFQGFYQNAASSKPTNLYSPGLAFLVRPLTWLDMATAFQVYVGINFAATLGVAYLAQRGVRSFEARVAVFLGVIALPQTQWALRSGHFSMVLAFLALSGFLLAERRPLLAGVCFGLLALKPQYLPIPILYLLWSRNGRALLGAAGTLVLLSAVGMAIVGVDPFVAQLQGMVHANLDHSSVYLPAQQAWQYSWQGFLISAGIEPNPLLTIDLLALSLGAVIVVWAKATPGAAKVAAALGMLLLAPYATFYNWSMIVVAAALLLRSDLRPRFLIPMLLAGGAIAAAATQKATPYPAANLLTAGTYGLYWIQPFALAAVFMLALAGRRREEPAAAAPSTPAVRVPWFALRRERLGLQLPRLALGITVALVALSSGYLLSAFVSQNGPFRAGPFDRQTVLRALPADFPLPPESTIEHAGRGALLPYRVQWQSTQPTSEVASLLRRKLDVGDWEIVLADGDENGLRLRTVRNGIDGEMEFFGEVTVAESEDGTVTQLEFTPIPTTLVPGFDDWLADRDANQEPEQLE